MEKIFFLLGGLTGGVGVALGAFAAHALRGRLAPEHLVTFETGVRYQLLHALALLIVGLATIALPASRLPVLAGWLFVAGTVLFSGSLYLLVFTRKRRWGAATPLGGLAFIVAWLCLALAALQL
jgi:uncharacterized membrane protein YgdD (TMEM256/DUF423 family)